MATERIGNFEFELNRHGRPWRAVSYFCHLSGERLSECTGRYCSHDPATIAEVEEHMVDWYNNAFAQMQDRIVTAQRMDHGI